MRVVWTAPALADLDELQDFVAADNPVAAFELASSLYRRTNDLLSERAMAGRAGRVPGTRELAVAGTSYVVAYRLRDAVEILAIVHGRRRWPDDFG